jgi:hypothetical protein
MPQPHEHIARAVFQPSHWTKTGSTIRVTFDEAAPGSGKLKKANSVASWGSIKNDVIKAGQQRSVGQ